MLIFVFLILFNISFSYSCEKEGAACSTLGQCCKGLYCVNSKCTKSEGCIPEYQLCVTGDKCCGDAQCVASQCFRPCVRAGNCTRDTDCCEGSFCVINDDNEGNKFCSRKCKEDKCDVFKDLCCDGVCKKGKCTSKYQCQLEDMKCNPITNQCCIDLYCHDQVCLEPCQKKYHHCDVDSDCCGSKLLCIKGTCRCSDYGEKCHSDAECCEDMTGVLSRCIHGVCRKTCYKLKSKCKMDTDCCSGYCEGGLCTESCKAEGRTCNSTSECCQGVCGEKSLCQKKDPCLKLGKKCQGNEDCCLETCIKGTCHIPCTPIGASCLEDTQGCCDGGHCINEICRKNPCIGYKQRCSSDEECCSNFCDDEICKYECYPDNHACNNAEECCGKICTNNKCSTPCLPNTQYCLFDYECCDNHCIGRQCLFPCSKYNEPCKSGKDCCNTVNCVNGVCEKDCLQKTYFCNNGTQCCSGHCQGGNCVK